MTPAAARPHDRPAQKPPVDVHLIAQGYPRKGRVPVGCPPRAIVDLVRVTRWRHREARSHQLGAVGDARDRLAVPGDRDPLPNARERPYAS